MAISPDKDNKFSHNTGKNTGKNTGSFILRYKLMIYGGLLLVLLLITGNSLYLSGQLRSQLLGEENHRTLQTLLTLRQTISVSLNHIGKMQSAVVTARNYPQLSPEKSAYQYLLDNSPGAPEGAPWDNLRSDLKEKSGQLLVRSGSRNTEPDVTALLSMMPEVVATHQQHADFQWSYYYDADQVLTQVYPWVSAEDLMAATGTTTMDEAIEVIYQAGGTYPLQLVGPRGNPDRAQVWTTPYMDAGGKGMMVSLLSPVYYQQKFTGAVGTDITLKVLDAILTEKYGGIARLVLVDKNGLVVGDSGGALQNETEPVTHLSVLSQMAVGATHTVTPGELQQSDTGFWLSHPLEGTPWNLVMEISNQQITDYIWRALTPNLIMAGFFATLLVAVVLYQHHQLSHPALKLARFVESLPGSTAPALPSVPAKWQHRFENALQAERDRRAYLDTIEKQTQQLEIRVAERTRELEQALETLKTAQDQLVQSEKLAALGSLVAGVAHELNTPIGNALMVATSLKSMNKNMASTIEKGLRRSDLDNYMTRNDESADSIEKNLNRAAELITSFKQVAVDQSSYRRRDFNLSETLHELEVTMGPRLRKNQIKLRLSCDSSVIMNSFPGPLIQVLMNLVSNSATHAFPDQEDRQLHIECLPVDDDHIRIEVRDNGTGVAKEHLSRLFEPFFTTRLGQGGSGLGLHIVYNLVTGILGGEVQAGSEAGAGTQITLTLPLEAPPTATA